jgi:sporulation protein YlmC with PRC-barrel domain
MRLGKDFDGKPIISIANGQILGRAKDLYVNHDLTQLAGLFVGTEGVIRRKDRLIPAGGIVLIGVDVILVKDADVITTAQALPESDKWHRLSQLHGKEVHTPGGTKLAAIDDITLDEEGAVSGFTLSRVYVSGPLAEEQMIPREVVVDAFQRSDALLVDFPKLEVMFGATPEGEPTVEEVEPVGEKQPEELPDDGEENG